MSDRYDFANLSPIEFEGLCIDLVAAETGLRFERFSQGADGGMDGRHTTVNGNIVLQAKHFKNSTWSNLQIAVKAEAKNLERLDPADYYLLTSQPLTPPRKDQIVGLLGHSSARAANVWGRTELNAFLTSHPKVERRNIKLWLSSAEVLDRLLNNDIGVFTEATYAEIERILKVFVANPSLRKSAEILSATHCLIVSGPPGVGKTTLAQVLAAEYSDDDWELVSLSSIEDGFKMFQRDRKQVFIFDDFLGKIKLEAASLAQDDAKIVRFLSLVHKDKDKRFILTTRAYILQAAKALSEALDDKKVEMSEMVLNLTSYTRELKARILYNHLYHSEIAQESIQALLIGDTVRRIVDHQNYMPRIVQWMTDDFMHREVSAADYAKAFLAALDSPDRIWDKAFNRHITNRAQILLYCMYVSPQEHFPHPGVGLVKLREFFERALVSFGAIKPVELRVAIFEETLREIKSSFVTVDGGRANFINPSVQDFLARQTQDVTVLSALARSVPTVSTAVLLWARAGKALPGNQRAVVAAELLERLFQGVSGQLPLHQLADLVGELVLASGKVDFVDRLRKEGLESLVWTDHGKLPGLIDQLVGAPYGQLPYARAYARFLRLEIFRFVTTESEYAIELEDLAELATGLASSGVEMSELFFHSFDEAVERAVDILDVDDITRGSDPSEVIGEWIERIDKIEAVSSTSLAHIKKASFEQRLSMIQQEEEDRRQIEEEEQREYPRSRYVRPRSSTGAGFSDEDMQSMFSSLKT